MSVSGTEQPVNDFNRSKVLQPVQDPVQDPIQDARQTRWSA